MLLDWGALIRPAAPSDRPHDANRGELPPTLGATCHPGQDAAAPDTATTPEDSAGIRAALTVVLAALSKALLLQHHHFPLPAVGWARAPGHLEKVLTETGPAVERGVMRCCLSCQHRLTPGLAFPGYCAMRADLPAAYGPGHPLHVLPADAGARCPSWGTCPAFPAVA